MLLYINDFLSDETVMLMDEFQFTWYMKMLMRAWKNEPACKLENDDESLMLAAGCTDKTLWDQKKNLVLRNWKVVDRGKYLTNGRLQEEFDKMCAISDKRSTAAKAKQLQANAVQTPANAQQVTATQTHTQTHIETKPKATPAQALPDWIPVDTWKAFTEMRRKIRKPLTDHAAMLMFKKLENLQTRGHPVQAVLEQSIVNDWQDVFELRNGNQTAPSTKMKSAAQVMKERNEQG